MGQTVWVALRVPQYQEDILELLGVFSTEQAASDVCTETTDMIGPVTVDDILPRDKIIWPGAYYPLAVME